MLLFCFKDILIYYKDIPNHLNVYLEFQDFNEQTQIKFELNINEFL
jgi:hypothetical protein